MKNKFLNVYRHVVSKNFLRTVKFRVVGVLLFGLFLLIGFQNCAGSNSVLDSSGVSSSNTTTGTTLPPTSPSNPPVANKANAFPINGSSPILTFTTGIVVDEKGILYMVDFMQGRGLKISSENALLKDYLFSTTYNVGTLVRDGNFMYASAPQGILKVDFNWAEVRSYLYYNMTYFTVKNSILFGLERNSSNNTWNLVTMDLSLEKPEKQILINNVDIGVPRAVGVDSQGSIYLVDYSRQQNVFTSGSVKKYNKLGVFQYQLTMPTGTTYKDFVGLSAIAIDGADNVYVGDGYGRIEKFNSSGSFVSEIYPMDHAGSLQGVFGIAIDQTGNIYATNQRSVKKFSPAGELLSVYGAEGPTRLNLPNGMAMGVGATNQDLLYIADSENGALKTFDPSGKLLNSIPYGDKSFPDKVWAGIDGSIYVSLVVNEYTPGEYADKIIKYDSAGKKLGEFGIDHAWFENYMMDAAGNVFTVDVANSRFYKYSFASGGTKANSIYTMLVKNSNGTPMALPAKTIYSMMDTKGNYFMQYSTDAARTKSMLMKFNTLGVLQYAVELNASAIKGVVTDNTGMSYLSSALEGKIIVLNPDGTQAFDFGGKGYTLGKLNSPLGLAMDSAGNIFVADSMNNRIQKFSSKGTALVQ